MNDGTRSPADDLWKRLAEAQDAAVNSSGNPPLRWPGQVSARRRGRGLLGRVGRLESTSGESRSMARWQRGRVRVAAVLVAGCAALTLVAAGLLTRKEPLRFHSGHTAQPGVVGRALLADARSDLPLQFSDGSIVTFRAGSAGRMQRLTGSGAEVMVERGRVEAQVVHAESTLWLVHAGPFQVRVTGTRFAVGWSAPNLEVVVYEGSVVVEGAPLGAGVPLRAGNRLTIRNGVVRSEVFPYQMLRASPNTVQAAPSATPRLTPGGAGLGTRPVSGDGVRLAGGGPATAPRGDPGGTDLEMAAGGVGGGTAQGPAGLPLRDRDWLSLAHRGAYAQAHTVARRLGWAGLCRRLDARRLLLLGDVARYAGARTDAHRAFASLARRFPGDRLAADAVFSLGRLAFESGRPGEAARWFKRYAIDWPHGPLVDQAIGRQVECAVRLDDRVAARGAAQAYLARAPNGPHAPLAHDVLGHSPDGSP